MKPYKAIDTRKDKRQPGRFTVQFRIAGQEESPPHQAATFDVSANSLGFDAAEMIPLDSKIDLELHLPQAPKPIAIQASVKRLEKTAEGTYTHGVVFDKIEPPDQAILNRYVQTSDINNVLRAATKKNASDVHLVAFQPPIFRIGGELFPQEGYPIPARDLRDMIGLILSDRQKEEFEKNLELDFSYLSMDGIRFLGNACMEKGNMEVSFRIIPQEIRTLAELGLPQVIEDLAKIKKGLILISGPAGHGKSTTMTTIIDLINRQRKCIIISIEDPIEYIHQSKLSVIKQREVGQDTLSLNQALKHILRQDVDVLLVGEMRDAESISIALSAAEGGHLVLSTLQISDTTECFNRIVDAFAEQEQSQVRSRLAGCIEAVIAQFLIPRSDGTGRIAATEVLIVTPAIRSLIRSGDIGQIRTYLETGASSGMHTMDSSLLDLVRQKVISHETALTYARDYKEF